MKRSEIFNMRTKLGHENGVLRALLLKGQFDNSTS